MSLLRASVGCSFVSLLFFFFQAEDGIRDLTVTGVQTCALPILVRSSSARPRAAWVVATPVGVRPRSPGTAGGACRGASGRRSRRAVCSHSTPRSEEHTSELQSQSNLVCRLLLEKKKRKECTRER